jgi:hypothetical protein
MKKLITLLAVLVGLQSAAQNIPPQAINFQGVAIDKNGIPVPGMDELGNPIQNSAIRVRFSILTGSATGTISYQEEHLTTTDEFGRFNLEIGRGTATNGVFSAINWGGDKQFLQVEVDLSALGTNFSLASIQEFLSMPYALYSKSSGSSNDDLDKDNQNEIQTLVLSGDLLSISQGNTVTLPAELDEQQLSISGAVISISNGNSITLPPDSDNQTLTVSGNNLIIANGNTVALPVSPDNQTLSISGSSISISNGNSVNLNINDGDSSSINELQTISKSNGIISLSNNGGIVVDSDNQNLSISGQTLSITGGNGVTIPVSSDNDSTNEIQTISFVNDTILLSKNGGRIYLPRITAASTSFGPSSGGSIDFNSNTNSQFVVPAGVSEVQFVIWGSNGGDSGCNCAGINWSCWCGFCSGGTQGRGGEGLDVQFRIKLSANDTIKIRIGNNGIMGANTTQRVQTSIGGTADSIHIWVNNAKLLTATGGGGGVSGSSPHNGSAPGCGSTGAQGNIYFFGSMIPVSSIQVNTSALNPYGLIDLNSSPNLTYRGSTRSNSVLILY